MTLPNLKLKVVDFLSFFSLRKNVILKMDFFFPEKVNSQVSFYISLLPIDNRKMKISEILILIKKVKFFIDFIVGSISDKSIGPQVQLNRIR